MGEHDFCASRGFGGPGGTDVSCNIYKKNGNWYLYNKDSSSAESNACRAICFVFK